jgi:hypothetical protein
VKSIAFTHAKCYSKTAAKEGSMTEEFLDAELVRQCRRTRRKVGKYTTFTLSGAVAERLERLMRPGETPEEAFVRLFRQYLLDHPEGPMQ